ncbi:uncharacterized protein [Haliotis cracherodii]|uniref:uncharacterized protein n=1 Tax=Haliotis cracherodii TaxID=6455 RepID=UPI0039E947C4
MLLPILLSSVSLALGQFLFASNAQISYRKGFQFEYHPTTHLLTVKNTYSCYFVGTDDSLRTRIKDEHSRETLQDELIGFIHNNKHIARTSLVQAAIAHNDAAATSGCVGNSLYELKYPSEGTTTTQGQTTTERTTQGQTTFPTTQRSTTHVVTMA